ncbi:hypothetical protein B0T10DRAFT_184040 [Thelonectria olida]|uniref:SET domain-containing protein n=1 Tax=Thelonectria olida TaxID=1576542 RepID=A0A9P9AUI7_9HYPO|nr:hypothetical protein B0T10DRAFT_184040 [Thelonectria olida]
MMPSSHQVSQLVSWATSHGAHLHPSLEVYQDAQTGLSFRVSPDAAEGTKPFDAIVSLPTSLTLSYLNALPGSKNDPKPFPAEFLDQTPPHVIGRFVLIKHYLVGDESFWAPYVRALPQPGEVDSWSLPPFWPSDDAELLEGTNVEVGIQKTRANVQTEFEHACALLAEEQWEPSLTSGLVLSLYQWAYSIFSSRSFRPSLVLPAADRESLPNGVGVDDFSVLLPLFDVGNHDMTEQVRWELDEGRASCQLKVARAYKPGEQVFNNYSLKTNAELLLGYGFMIPETESLHNDYVHVRKRQAASGPSAEEYYISLRPIHYPSSLLARSKQTLQLSESTKVIGAFQHVQHDMVWDIFCTLVPSEHHSQLIPTDSNLQSDAAEQARLDAFFSGKVSGDAIMLLQQTAAIIQHKVMQELERLDETDLEVVGEGDLTRNQQLALTYRAQCRRVLENTLEAMEADELLGQDDESG